MYGLGTGANGKSAEAQSCVIIYTDEVVRLLDACMRHHDHFNGFKVAAMLLLGIAMGFRDEWLS